MPIVYYFRMQKIIINSRKLKICFFVLTPAWLHVINMLIQFESINIDLYIII